MSSSNKIFLNRRDIEIHDQEMRCRQALAIIDVPNDIVWKFDGPILFQLAHLCVYIDEPMHYRDALRWIYDHRGEILEHAKKVERDRLVQDPTALDKTN